METTVKRTKRKKKRRSVEDTAKSAFTLYFKSFILLDYLYQVSHVVTIINLLNYTDYPEGFYDRRLGAGEGRVSFSIFTLLKRSI